MNKYIVFFIFFSLTSSCNLNKELVMSDEKKLEYIENEHYNFADIMFYDKQGKIVTQEYFSELEAWEDNIGFDMVSRNQKIKKIVLRNQNQKDSIFNNKLVNFFYLHPKTANQWLKSFYVKDSTFQLKRAMVATNSPNEICEVDCAKKRSILNEVYKKDQFLRTTNASFLELLIGDRENENLAMSVLKKCGFPSKEEVGDTAVWAMIFVVQHSQRLEVQEYFLNPFFEMAKRNELEKYIPAYLQDRILVSKKQKQIYGTQYYYTNQGGKVLYPIKNFLKVDSLRTTVDLGTLKTYIQEEGIISPAATFE